MRRHKTIASISIVIACAALMLVGCSRNNAAQDNGDAAASGGVPLPQPQVTGGSVTGMPDSPGPRAAASPTAGTDAAIPPGTAIVSDDSMGVPPTDGAASGDAGLPPDAAGAQSDEPTPQDAVAVIRDYYAAINDQNYAHARALWSDGGRSSGQTPEQFADGFANTTDVSVDTEAPGRIDAAAGSRFIEVPVTIEATQRDGSARRYAGVYTLRRAMVDGATADQRAWRIASAQLHEVKP